MVKQQSLSQSDRKILTNLQYTKKIDQFLQKIQDLKKSGVKLDDSFNEKALRYKLIIDKIDTNIMQMKKNLSKGWTVIRQNTQKNRNQKVKLGVKIDKYTIETKYEGQFFVHPFNLCVMFKEVDLYHRWMPFCVQSKIAKQHGMLQQDVYLKFKIPLLNERYLFFHGIGIDRVQKNQSLIIYCQGIQIPSLLSSMSKANIKETIGFDPRNFDPQIEKNSPLIMNSFIVQLTYIKSHTVSIKTYGKLTTRMAKIPSWLINYLMKEISTTLIERIVKQAGSLKYTPWQKQMSKKTKEGFYLYLGKRINEWTNDSTVKPKL